MKMRNICWTYVLIECLAKELYHQGNKLVETTKSKRRYMEGNMVETVK